MNHWYLSILLIVSLSFYATGQSSAELEKQQKKLRENIQYTEKILNQIKEDTKNNATRVKLLDDKIEQREELIGSIRQELDLIDKKMQENEDLIVALENDIQVLKQEYAKMVVQAYKTRDQSNTILFIFASKDFDQAYHRMKYLQQLTEYRQKQAEAIDYTQKMLLQKREALAVQREEKNLVLNNQNQEKITLNREKQEKEKKVAELLTQETRYRKDLAEAQKRSDEIREAIRQAIIRESQLTSAGGDKKPGTTSGFVLTPESQEMGHNFMASKGKLPWPVNAGKIIARYGPQPHPFLPDIKIYKDGITLSTTEGSRARAVFEGEVSHILILPGVGKVVMIHHGEFVTVYMNLKETFVSTGDKVKMKEEIGTIITDKGKTEMEFQVWKGTELQDPMIWLFKAQQ